MSEEKCCAKVHDGGRHITFHNCFNKAKVKRKGKWYCGVHDPDKAEKRNEYAACWAARAKAQKRRREEQEAGRVFLRLREAIRHNPGAFGEALADLDGNADLMDPTKTADEISLRVMVRVFAATDLPTLSAAADKVLGGEG